MYKSNIKRHYYFILNFIYKTFIKCKKIVLKSKLILSDIIKFINWLDFQLTIFLISILILLKS